MEQDLSTGSQTSNSSKREFLTEKYTEQLKRWPKAGKHILAQFTDEYVCSFFFFLIKGYRLSSIQSSNCKIRCRKSGNSTKKFLISEIWRREL